MTKETSSTRIGLVARKKIVEEFQTRTKSAQGCFFIGFNKVLAPSFTNLRNTLKDEKASIFVSKNSLMKKALINIGWQDTDNLLDKETGVVLADGQDIVKICKILVTFAAENETLALKGGIIDNKKISPQEINAMAKLPSRETLLAMAVSAIASPLTGFVNSLSQVIVKFLWTVEEIKKAKAKQ